MFNCCERRRSENALDGQLASTLEPIELCMASCQGRYAKFFSMITPKCSIVENGGELKLMAFHIHFLPQQQYSRVYALFWLFTLWFIDEDASFFHFFQKTNIKSWRCFSSSKIRFAHILQHYHDFQSNVAIFPSVVQAYTQPYSFGGRIKLIIYQIRHEVNKD